MSYQDRAHGLPEVFQDNIVGQPSSVESLPDNGVVVLVLHPPDVWEDKTIIDGGGAKRFINRGGNRDSILPLGLDVWDGGDPSTEIKVCALEGFQGTWSEAEREGKVEPESPFVVTSVTHDAGDVVLGHNVMPLTFNPESPYALAGVAIDVATLNGTLEPLGQGTDMLVGRGVGYFLLSGEPCTEPLDFELGYVGKVSVVSGVHVTEVTVGDSLLFLRVLGLPVEDRLIDHLPKILERNREVLVGCGSVDNCYNSIEIGRDSARAGFLPVWYLVMAKLPRLTSSGFTAIPRWLLVPIIRGEFSKRDTRILMAIANYQWWSADESTVQVSHPELAEIVGVHAKHIARALRELSAKGVIEVVKGSGRSSSIIRIRNSSEWSVEGAQCAPSTVESRGSAFCPVEGAQCAPSTEVSTSSSNFNQITKGAGEPLGCLDSTESEGGGEEVEREWNGLRFGEPPEVLSVFQSRGIGILLGQAEAKWSQQFAADGGQPVPLDDLVRIVEDVQEGARDRGKQVHAIGYFVPAIQRAFEENHRQWSKPVKHVAIDTAIWDPKTKFMTGADLAQKQAERNERNYAYAQFMIRKATKAEIDRFYDPKKSLRRCLGEMADARRAASEEALSA